VVAGPVNRVAAALATPFERGAGRPFAAFAELASLRRPPEVRREEGPLIRQTPEAPGVRVRVEYPPDGAAVSDLGCGAFVAGTVAPADLRRFDVVFVIDTSHSTFAGTGADINGNGIVGVPAGGPVGGLLNVDHTDPGDSILAAEVAAARVLLADLDPRSTRAAVVAFAGRDESAMASMWDGLARAFGDNHQHARTLKPLTADHAQVESALDEILALTPVGQTHIAAGLDQAISELLGLRGALSRRDERSEKVVFLFTDGRPTLPYPGREGANVRAVLDAADRAARAGIHVHSFAIGPEALEAPITTVEMAARTGGYFTPIRRPADLANAVQAVDFPRLRDLFLGNQTTKSPAQPFRVEPSGAWAGFVPVAPGRNRIAVRALADDGTETVRELSLRLDPGAAEAAIPLELAPRRNLLLADCLRELRNRRAEAERLRNEQVRKRLRLEIEQEREKAHERAAQQRRELELEVEKDPSRP
jgi:Mg-chelatase subunit ChlD